MNLPFSASADRNKGVIGDALADYFNGAVSVIEIGSGSGQHAVYLSERFSHLHWQPTDREKNLPGLRQVIAQSTGRNIKLPVVMDVADYASSGDLYSLAYSANTAHIMSEDEVAAMFAVAGSHLGADNHFVLYGPFMFGGKHTAASNAEFDLMLREQASHMGIRDKHTLDGFADSAGLEFIESINMPSNNHVLVWRRKQIC